MGTIGTWVGRRILRRLAAGPATVGELAQPFRMSQQAVSKHLAYLERANLIRKHREGRQNVCTLNRGPLREVAAWAEEFRRFWEESYDRLDDLLGELKAKEGKRAREDEIHD